MSAHNFGRLEYTLVDFSAGERFDDGKNNLHPHVVDHGETVLGLLQHAADLCDTHHQRTPSTHTTTQTRVRNRFVARHAGTPLQKAALTTFALTHLCRKTPLR